MSSASNKTALDKLGITHILNVTATVPNYFISDKKFKYGRIALDDVGGHSIYDYFEASKDFINQCNPSIVNHNKNKILIHCAVGMSRSASICIAYLISMKIKFNENDQNRLDFIKNKLNNDTFKHDMHNNIKQYIQIMDQQFGYLKDENNLSEKERNDLNEYRSKYHENKGLKLNEAYYYVKSCRNLIAPNIGFCAQLHKYEKLYHSNDGIMTLCDLEKFTLLTNIEYIECIWQEASNQYPNAKNRHNSFCIVL